MGKELIKELGYKVKLRELTWQDVANEYNKKFNDNVTANAMRNRYNRIVGTSSVKKEEEIHNQDGSIEIEKKVWFNQDEPKTPETILKKFGYDIDSWELVEWRFGKWEVAIKGEDNRECTTIRAKIKPIAKQELSLEQYLKIAKEVFEKEIKPFDKTTEKSKRISSNVNKLMLIPQIEAHLGKLSNEIETGVNYDHKIVEERVNKVFDEAIELQRYQKCNKCLLVIGGDFFNSESNSQTTGGTPQQNDTRYKKMFNVGLNLYLNGIMKLREEFNEVDIKLCAGNHSRAMEFFLYIALSCYFKNDKKVNFCKDYKDTQSYVFGDVGLFFNHGDPNQKRLIASIPAEFYQEYGKTKYRYLFLGHLHKLEVINSENGLTVHRVPAICENDGWHYQNRFGIGNIPQHEIIIFDMNCGMLSSNFVYFENSKKKMIRR